MTTFETEVCDPTQDNEPVKVTVTFAMEDVGVMMRPNERVEPVLKSVVRCSDGVDLLGALDMFAMAGLEIQALAEVPFRLTR